MALVNSAFTVNVTPGAMPPTVHVSEYDIGRTYTVTMVWESDGSVTLTASSETYIRLNAPCSDTSAVVITRNQPLTSE